MLRTLTVVVFAFCTSVAHAEAIFAIKPYTIQLPDSSWLMSWAYESGKEPLTQSLEVSINDHLSQIPVVTENGLSHAKLPLPVCNFGKVTYQLSGLADPVLLADLPCTTAYRPTRFTFLADTQEGPQHVIQFANQIKTFQSAALIVGGDLVQEGTSVSDWLKFFDALSPILESTIFIPVVGNHEYRHSKDVPLWKHFFKREAQDAFFAQDIGPVHVIVLNSCFEDDRTLALKQLPWLESELEKPARWKVVVYHHPAYSRGFFNNPLSPLKEHLILQRDYLPLFETHHVDLVLNGHTHLFEHSVKSGIHYLTMGPAGGKMGLYGALNPYSINSSEKRTVLEVEVGQTQLRAVTTDISGQVLDDFEIQKN